MMLSGEASPGARVRLATPSGEAIFAQADAGGAWRLIAPTPTQVRLYGLSMNEDRRTIQSEGYLALTPGGMVAQLRAGSGAVDIGAPRTALRIDAVDFDRKGGAVVSGAAPANSALRVLVDSTQRGSAVADRAGRFSLALNEPLSPGGHTLGAARAAASRSVEVTVSPAVPLERQPFRASPADGGWRIDWITPGGGVQSTLLFEPREGAGT